MRKISMGLAVILGLLTGCGGKQPIDPYSDDLATVNNALLLNQVQAVYDNCVNNLGDDHPSCENMDRMYEDAKAQYEAEQPAKSFTEP